jgi:hypothetical protein
MSEARQQGDVDAIQNRTWARRVYSTPCTASRSRVNWCWAGSGPQGPLHGKVGADHLLVDGQS